MKTIKRLVLGVISSLLLAVGLARAADQFDPMSRSLTAADQNAATSASLDCGTAVCSVSDTQG